VVDSAIKLNKVFGGGLPEKGLGRRGGTKHKPIAVPDSLTELDRWAVWRWENERKVPCRVDGRRASSTSEADWGEFDVALRAAKTGRFAGLGFAFFKEDGLAGIDLDDSLDSSGNVKPWAARVVERFADSYTEISPSGNGLKIWVRGSLPSNLPGVKVADGQIEMYDCRRYFAVTGRGFRGTPLQVEDHTADLIALYERLTQASKGRGRWPLHPLEGGRIPYGQQHATLVSIAGTLRARQLCDEAIEACLQVVNVRQCERPGLPENIARIVRSSRKWGATQ
jgi:hypothetical protein